MNLQYALLILLSFQGVLILVDEFVCHRRRGLGKWEQWGHPIDTGVFVAALAAAAFAPPTDGWIAGFVVMAIASALIVTKDEWVHSRECDGLESQLHSFMFLLHPTILIAVGTLWIQGEAVMLRQSLPVFATIWCMVQMIHGYGIRRRQEQGPSIDNEFYDHLGDQWYEDDRHPVALLRAEATTKLEYLDQILTTHAKASPASILDMGCGAGFIANPLAAKGHQVTGIDQSESSLEVATRYDRTNSARYLPADVYKLPFPDRHFDVVLLLDVLEHLEHPQQALAEASRVVRPDGIVVFHTFNRNWLSYLLAVKALDVLVRNGPKHIHIYRLLIRPTELVDSCSKVGLSVRDIVGIRPRLLRWAALFSVLSGRLHRDFEFTLTPSKAVGYLGYALPTP